MLRIERVSHVLLREVLLKPSRINFKTVILVSLSIAKVGKSHTKSVPYISALTLGGPMVDMEINETSQGLIFAKRSTFHEQPFRWTFSG